LIVSQPLFQIFPISRHDNSGSLSPRPQRAWMVKPLALAEMPKVYHRVRQGFQGIVQFTDALETDQ